MQFADVACALKMQTAIITAFQIQGTGTRYRFPAGTAQQGAPPRRAAFSSNRVSWRTALPVVRGAP